MLHDLFTPVLRLPAIGNVNDAANIAEKTAVGSVHRCAVIAMPAVRAVVAAGTALDDELLPSIERAAKGAEPLVEIVGVDDVYPAVAKLAINWPTGEIQPAAVEVRRLLVRPGEPDNHGRRVSKRPEPLERHGAQSNGTEARPLYPPNGSVTDRRSAVSIAAARAWVALTSDRGRASAGWPNWVFGRPSVDAIQDCDVNTGLARRRVAFTCAVVALALSGGALAVRAAPPCAEILEPAGAAALKPPDVLLGIVAPRAGETVVAATPGDSIQLVVDYWGPRLVGAETARMIDEYHLAYFLDEEAAPYLNTLQAIPRCNARIVHTAQTSITFKDVPKGSHTLSVVLAGSNNVAVNPPVMARVTFTVR
jgi:hypothetical protein